MNIQAGENCNKMPNGYANRGTSENRARFA